jgi:N-acetylglucosaminyldiphosphoundecaprenol N-acetyl-beta-D-mannosaminyltransferase
LIRDLVVILGTPVDDLDMPQTLDRIEELIEVGRSSGKGRQVVTANTDFLVNALKDAELRRIIQHSDLCTPDGMPLVWGARLLGAPLRGRVAGADIVPQLAERAAQKGFSLFFLGAEPGVAARAAEILTKRLPGLRIVGVESPPFQPIEKTQPELLARIRAANPDVLMVAFGNPKQEKWIARFGPQINVPVMMGVGGSLDFIAGKTRRAPQWMQRSGLEWLYRLMQEPRRLWQRYAADLMVFSLFFARQWWATRRRWPAPAVQPGLIPITGELLRIQDTAIITLDREFTAKDREGFQSTARQALVLSRHIIVNMEQTEFLDSSAIGSLVALARQAREAGGDLWLSGARPNICRTLALLRLDSFFTCAADVNACLQDRLKRAERSHTLQPA